MTMCVRRTETNLRVSICAREAHGWWIIIFVVCVRFLHFTLFELIFFILSFYVGVGPFFLIRFNAAEQVRQQKNHIFVFFSAPAAVYYNVCARECYFLDAAKKQAK